MTTESIKRTPYDSIQQIRKPRCAQPRDVRGAIEAPIKRLSAYIGLRPTFRAFLDWVLELRAEIGVPHTLAGLDVSDQHIERIVAMAPQDPTAGGNPRPFDRRAARTIFRRALAGRV